MAGQRHAQERPVPEVRVVDAQAAAVAQVAVAQVVARVAASAAEGGVVVRRRRAVVPIVRKYDQPDR